MALIKYKLEELIEQRDIRNQDEVLSIDDVRGISTDKTFIDTKANIEGISLKSYKIVSNDEFAYVADTSRRGDKIAIAYNGNETRILISSIYTVFKVSKPNILLSGYLFIYFNRPEFDRYSRFNSWGSARETFSWEDLCDIDIELPSLSVQQKYVDIYNSMLANQQSYEHGLEDLKLVCDAYIEDLRRNIPTESIGEYIELKRNKNSDDSISDVYGVSNSLKFITAGSTVDKTNLAGYKIVNYGDIAYVPTTHMKIWAAAISDKENPFVVSPIYEVFGIKDKIKLCPEYLFLWLCRNETIRYAFYNSWGSARENFVFDDMCSIRIPIPSIEIQRSIVDIFKTYKTRMEISEKLKQQIKDICPILIKGSIEEGRKAKEV